MPPALSEPLPACTSTRSKFPMVSTNTCRLRPTTFFVGVVAALTSHLGGLGTLTIQDGGAGLRIASGRSPHAFSQRIVDLDPGPPPRPPIKVVAPRPPVGKLMGEQPPLATGAGQIH